MPYKTKLYNALEEMIYLATGGLNSYRKARINVTLAMNDHVLWT